MNEWSIWVCIGNLRALECRLGRWSWQGENDALMETTNFIFEVLVQSAMHQLFKLWNLIPEKMPLLGPQYLSLLCLIAISSSPLTNFISPLSFQIIISLASSNFPSLIPYLQPIYPNIPPKLARPTAPEKACQAGKPIRNAGRAAIAIVPAAMAEYVQSSTSSWPLFSRIRHVRSFHWISCWPRM